MLGSKPPLPGTIAWSDLTVPDARKVRDFYAAVAGWKVEALSMGTYSDYLMREPGSGQAVAGVCHDRGVNADLPAQWLVYITVANLDAALRACVRRGGEVVAGPKGMSGASRYAVIRDPAGAVAALFEPAPLKKAAPRPARKRGR
jgi:hypothetical protein